MLDAWVAGRGTPITIRLVKGAYWDYEVLHARQLGWPVPVYLDKWRSDASFERCARFLMENHERLRPAAGEPQHPEPGPRDGHGRGARRAGRRATRSRCSTGWARRSSGPWSPAGGRVRVYTPYGAMLPGMAYLVRRLLENTSNESFLLKASVTDRAGVDEELLKNPEEVGAMWPLKRRAAVKPGGRPASPRSATSPRPTSPGPRPANDAMRPSPSTGSATSSMPALTAARSSSTARSPRGSAPSTSGCPATPRGSSARAAPPASATPTAPSPPPARRSSAWSGTPARERAGVLLRAAAILRRDRFKLAAIEVFECGKPWREADGDLAEAIDFCEFYAREMIRLDRARAPRRPRRDQRGSSGSPEGSSSSSPPGTSPWRSRPG